MSRSHDATTPKQAWEAAEHYVGQALFLVRSALHEKDDGWKGKVETAQAELIGRLNLLAWQMEKNRHYKDQQKLRDIVRFITQADMNDAVVCDKIEEKTDSFEPA